MGAGSLIISFRRSVFDVYDWLRMLRIYTGGGIWSLLNPPISPPEHNARQKVINSCICHATSSPSLVLL